MGTLHRTHRNPMTSVDSDRRADHRGLLRGLTRAGRTAFVAAVVFCLATLSALPMSAQDIPHLTSQVTDQTGALGAASAVQPALDSLLKDHGVQLWVVFVPTTGSTTAPDFAQTTYQQNGLGGNDVLLLVAVNDHRYGWWAAQNGPLEPIRNDVDTILSNSIEAPFRAGDYAGGVSQFAAALGQRLSSAGQPAQPATQQPGGTSSQPSGQPAGQSSDPLLGVVGALILVLAGVAILWAWLSRRRADHRAAEERDRRMAQLARDANALLIQTDDAVRESQQEIGFVEAQFGEDDAAAYRDALAQATAELKAAFEVRQRLDDATPEDPPTREQMLNEVLGRAQRAAGLLDEQHKRVASLRESEAKAPELLAALPSAIDVVAARLPATQAAFARLQAYAPATWATVGGNGSEAEKRIASARAETEAGRVGLTTDIHAAAKHARVAQAATTQASALLDAIEKLVASLDETRQRLTAEIAAAAPDVERARAAVVAGKVDAAAGQHVDEAERLLAEARTQAASSQPDVVAGYQAAQQANQLADAVLEGVRAAEERQARAVAALASALHSATTSVDRTNDYITSRHHGVGREARTRLAEAERHLALANQLMSSDPARCLRGGAGRRSATPTRPTSSPGTTSTTSTSAAAGDAAATSRGPSSAGSSSAGSSAAWAAADEAAGAERRGVAVASAAAGAASAAAVASAAGGGGGGGFGGGGGW